MPNSSIPKGFHAVTPYLIVPGVPRLIDFMAEAFGAVEAMRHHRPNGSVMHAQVNIDGSPLMMGEASDAWPAMPSSLYLYVADADAIHAKALAAGGTSIMEPADQPHGDRLGGIKDPSGNLWWIAQHLETVSPDEMAAHRRATEKPS